MANPATDRAARENMENPLLRKVSMLLEKTNPKKWRRYTEPLDPNQRHTKPREAWEQAYTLDLPQGVLCLRHSQEVTSQYAVGGYTLSPTGTEFFRVEMRAEKWDARELVDPGVQRKPGEQRCDIIAEGHIAKELYRLIESTLKKHIESQQHDFESKAEMLLRNIKTQIRKMKFSDFEKIEDSIGVRSYRACIAGITVEISSKCRNRSQLYLLTAENAGLTYEHRDPLLAREVFEMIEQLEQNTSLLALTKALEGMSA